MIETARNPVTESRLPWLDNLRTFMIFLIGSLCHKLKAFETAGGGGKRLYFLASFTVWIPVCLYLFMVIHFLMKPGEYILSGIGDGLLIRFSFLVSLLGLLYLLVNTFRFHLNGDGRIGQGLNRNSYSVYIIHVVVMGGIALMMLDSPISSFSKYLVLVLSTYAVSNLLSYAYRKATSVLGPACSMDYPMRGGKLTIQGPSARVRS